ncbi:hypothetical protein HDU67_007892 [Dinochytrium kinnereticum]|nr:hypothetical protein HDU67_007892 [Dinochytrium kinnereticum]
MVEGGTCRQAKAHCTTLTDYDAEYSSGRDYALTRSALAKVEGGTTREATEGRSGKRKTTLWKGTLNRVVLIGEKYPAMSAISQYAPTRFYHFMVCSDKDKGSSDEPKFFDGLDFFFWKPRMTNYLKAKGLKSVTSEGFIPLGASSTKEERAKHAEAVEKDHKAKGRIEGCISNKFLLLIKDHKTVKEVWDAVVTAYEWNAHANRNALLRKLTNGEELNEFISSLTKVPQQLEAAGTDERLVGDYLQIVGRLLDFELKIKDRSRKDSDGEAYHVSKKNRKAFGAKKSNGTSAGKSGKEDWTCFYCNKKGHLWKDC